MGQYKDIFEDFEKVKSFEFFLKHNNINEIIHHFKELMKHKT